MRVTTIFAGGLLLACAGAVQAQQLIYEPRSPSFGGDPLNGSFLLNKAQAQDTYTDPNAPDFGSFSETDFFLQDLRNSLVNDAISDAVEGEEGRSSLIESSTLRIRIDSTGQGGFVMTILDRRTGETTTVNLGQVNGQF
ncbi:MULTISPECIES: curli assembly protein CsgF [unclassified Thioalkalivibrio]|uniref:curli assembly protein CsgF n=1 Tax=unclassified Thioalkalivibrio TaxID=2621013 RepID=UPI000371265E|nr:MULTISPECIES: curli assembly protein CsgF [unclassified Thioalkalivibrio]